MRKCIKTLAVFAVIFSLSACSGKSEKSGPLSKIKESVKQAKEAGETAKNIQKVVSNAGDMQAQMEHLAEVEPLSQSELKEWFPTEIDGFKRTAYKGGEAAMLNVVSGNATYKKDDEENQSFTIDLTDGAGSMAGSIVSMFQMRMQMDMEEEDENGYTRMVDKNGYRAEEKQSDRYNSAGLMFLEGQRFAVQIEGQNMTADELWDVVKKLKLNQLPGI